MPVISKFYGIVIRMLCARLLGAHFHAFYEDSELLVSICPLGIIQGEAPGWVREMVIAWASRHQQELLADWDRCVAGQRPQPIDPFD
ncbi:MAG TPA: DUF4160 domain-containing protein [Candidatus Paceibacterota bacterium]|nr:DUF4160 domain-containing protein [Verrucomicrobiota bacterium]HRZ46042.1 DUF4160 domain-containing protein [Candidatus Paceibacterota bacterium]